MKYFFAIMILGLFGCRKNIQIDDEPPTDNLLLGEISNLKVNNDDLPKKDFNLTIGTYTYDTCQIPHFSLIVRQSMNIGEWRESLGFSKIPIGKLGKIKLPDNVISSGGVCDTVPNIYFFIGGSDYITSSYKLVQGADNQLFIDNFNRIKKEVTGTFDVTLSKIFKSESFKNPYPDTIRFHSAKFRVNVR